MQLQNMDRFVGSPSIVYIYVVIVFPCTAFSCKTDVGFRNHDFLLYNYFLSCIRKKKLQIQCVPEKTWLCALNNISNGSQSFFLRTLVVGSLNVGTYIAIAEISFPFLYTHSQVEGGKSNFIMLIISRES